MQFAGAFVQNAGFNDRAVNDHFSDTAVKYGDRETDKKGTQPPLRQVPRIRTICPIDLLDPAILRRAHRDQIDAPRGPLDSRQAKESRGSEAKEGFQACFLISLLA
jgi:hypothetical protein